MLQVLLLLACCGAAGARAATAELAVIVSSSAPQSHLDENRLRNIYLKRVYLDRAGHALVPVNLPPGNPLRQAFLHATLHMSDTQMQNYWNRKYFQGVSPPYVLGSQAAVVQFVAKTPGAIGYVRACRITPKVKVVARLTIALSAADAKGCTD
jgi:ABC-type phosphate transport system substrate-binding protein